MPYLHFGAGVPLFAQGSTVPPGAMPHRDQNGVLFMWDDAVQGPPPPFAPPGTVLGPDGNVIPAEQAGTLLGGGAIPPFGPIAPEPPSTSATSVPRPRGGTRAVLTALQPKPAPPPMTSTSRPAPGGGVVDEAKKSVLKEVGLLLLLTAPAWATMLLTRRAS